MPSVKAYCILTELHKSLVFSGAGRSVARQTQFKPPPLRHAPENTLTKLIAYHPIRNFIATPFMQ